MAIHFESTPPAVSFSGNPMRFRIHHQNVYPNRALTSQVTHRFTFSDTDDTPDHSITLTIIGVDYTFTLKTTPVDPFDLPVAASEVAADWAAAVFARFQQNHLFVSNYLMTLDSTVITLVAFSEGADYDIALVDSDIVGMDFSTITPNPMLAYADEVFLFIVNSSLQIMATEHKPLSSSQYVDFEVSEYFAGWLASLATPRFHPTVAPSTFMYMYSDQVKKYKAGTALKLDGVFQTIVWDTDRWGITGGLNRQGLIYWNTISGGFWAAAGNLTRFLTWCPNSKRTSRSALEVLYFFVQSQVYTSVNLRVQIYCTDGTSVSPTTIATLTTSSTTYYVVECLCGHDQMGLQSIAGKTVSFYKVWLANQDLTRISDEFTFVIDENYYEYERTFFFRNSFGVFDTIRVTGKREKNLEYERETATILSDVTEDSYNPPVTVIKSLETQVFAASTGWVSLGMFGFLREFLLSKEIYEVTTSKISKCVITTKKTKKMLRDGEYNYAIDFEFSRAYQDNFYTTY